MTRIVRSTYSYKRPPKKRKLNPAALAMPTIVTAKKPKPRRPGDPPIRRQGGAAAPPDPTPPANDDRKSVTIATKPGKPMPVPATEARPSAIVTARKPGKRYVDVPDMTPEEHKRRGDAADALWHEMKRRITKNDDKS